MYVKALISSFWEIRITTQLDVSLEAKIPNQAHAISTAIFIACLTNMINKNLVVCFKIKPTVPKVFLLI